MPKFAKRFLIVLASLVGIGALFLLCINLYLQSGGVQQRIHDAVVRSIGAEVQIGSISFTPWHGLVLRDIQLPNSLVAGENLVDAKALRIRFSFFPLFRQKFIITDCTLFEPRLIIHQIEGGNWMVPLPPKISKAPKSPTESPTETPATPSTPKPTGPVFHAELQHLRLNNGYVAFVDLKGRIVLQLEKADIDAQIARDLTAVGTIDVARADVASYLKPHKMSSPFTWNGKVLDLSEIVGSLAGGKMTGSYRVNVGPGKPSFVLAADLEDVSLKKLVAEAGMDAGQTEGQLRGTLQLAGDPRTSDNTTGNGHFELLQAQLKPVEFISKLGLLFQIEELQLLQLKEAKTDLSVHDQKVWIDNLFLKSENLALHASGPIRFNGKMNLNAELLINRKLQEQLKIVIELLGLDKEFVASTDPEYRQLPFTVTGRIQNPKTNLDKLFGTGVGQAVGAFKNLFHTAPTPSATPAEPEPVDGN